MRCVGADAAWPTFGTASRFGGRRLVLVCGRFRLVFAMKP
jgi:hypothetical protein